MCIRDSPFFHPLLPFRSWINLFPKTTPSVTPPSCDSPSYRSPFYPFHIILLLPPPSVVYHRIISHFSIILLSHLTLFSLSNPLFLWFPLSGNFAKTYKKINTQTPTLESLYCFRWWKNCVLTILQPIQLFYPLPLEGRENAKLFKFVRTSIDFVRIFFCLGSYREGGRVKKFHLLCTY